VADPLPDVEERVRRELCRIAPTLGDLGLALRDLTDDTGGDSSNNLKVEAQRNARRMRSRSWAEA